MSNANPDNRIARLIGARFEERKKSYEAEQARAVAVDARARRAAYEAELDARFRQEAIEAYEAKQPRPTYEMVADQILGATRHVDPVIGSCPDPTQRAATVALLSKQYAESK